MAKFIKKTVLFIIAGILILMAVTLIPDYVVNKKSRFVIDRNNRIVLFGHSHPECAFDDTLINNLKNLSHSAEPYFYSYQKVKMVLKQNPLIETVLIEFTNNQIDPKMDEWTWGYKYMSSMFPKYLPFMDASDLQVLMKNNPKYFVSCLSVSTRNNLVRLLTSDYEFTKAMGGYQRINASQTKLTADSAGAGQEELIRHGVSSVNLFYLRKIIDYCTQCHKKVLLVRSPQHRSYEYLKNEQEFLAIKRAMFPSTEFLDFGRFPLRDDEFADFGHLNYKGAVKFSRWFNTMLNSGLLNAAGKQYLIDQSISRMAANDQTINRVANWRKPVSFSVCP